jgi:hypothetical protein
MKRIITTTTTARKSTLALVFVIHCLICTNLAQT